MPGMIYEPRPGEHVPGDGRDPHHEERMNPTSHPRCTALIATAALMAAITAAAGQPADPSAYGRRIYLDKA